MRHRKAGRRLGVTTAHRKAMMRNMVTSILEEGQVTTTLARAKEVRRPLEKMITFAKRGDLHARRLALRFVKSKLAMANLFGELAERYQERPGGYCRIIKLATTRAGDASDRAIVQLIGSEQDVLTALKDAKQKKQPAKQASKTLEKVSAEVKGEEKPKAEQAAEEAPAEPEAQEAAPAEETSEAADAKAEAVAENASEAPAAQAAPAEEATLAAEAASEDAAPAEEAKPDAKDAEPKS